MITEQQTFFGDKSYNGYGPYLRNKYGEKVFKVSVDAGFTCPNRDGSKGFGGCTYCNVDSFTPVLTRENSDIEGQLEKNMAFMADHYGANKFIIYFQPNTNTYAPVDQLEKIFNRALKVNSDNVVGLSIGTRSDCLDNEKLDLLEELNSRVDVDLEIGMESAYEESLKMLNRGHTHKEFMEMMEICKSRSFDMCVHTIFGLPGESKKMMLDVASVLNELPIKFAKLHHLYIVKGSVLGVKYTKEPFPLFSKESYADFLSEFIPKLRPNIILQRIFGISDYEYHIAPNWGLKKASITNYIDSYLKERLIVQGAEYQKILING